MRRFVATLVIIAGTAFAVVAAASRAEAQNYPWCAQYSSNMGGSMNCGFASFEQCMATVSGIGGFCVQNNTYQPPVTPRSQQRRPDVR